MGKISELNEKDELNKIRMKKLKELLSQRNNIPNYVISIKSMSHFKDIIEIYAKNLIIMEFYADWCAPCKNFRPIYERLQQTYYVNEIVFTRIDSDEFPEVMKFFGLLSVPSMIFIKDKTAIFRHIGAMSKGRFQKLISDVIRKYYPPQQI